MTNKAQEIFCGTLFG